MAVPDCPSYSLFFRLSDRLHLAGEETHLFGFQGCQKDRQADVGWHADSLELRARQVDPLR